MVDAQHRPGFLLRALLLVLALGALLLLQQEFLGHPEDRVLFVKADRTLRYGEVMAAMELARDAGARVVAAITEQKPGAEDERKGGE